MIRFFILFCSATGLVLGGNALQAAVPTEAELLAGASQRIEKHRKADITLRVVDAQGRPVSDVEVKVEQKRHAFLFGCNIFLWGHAGNDKDEAGYRRQFAELFNFATLPFYWPSYEPRRGQTIQSRIEKVATWCKEQGITTKGHPLAWNFADPAWLPDDLEEIQTLQMARIEQCAGHFKGLIDTWDVVNEATHYERDDFKKGAPKMTALWAKMGRLEFVEECFQHARKANPKATLLINDYRVDPAYVTLLTKLSAGPGKAPFDVIGIQSHMHGGAWSTTHIWEVCERFAKFSKPLHFTETTIISGRRGWELGRKGERWSSTPEGEKYQAENVERFYTMLFSHPAVQAITWWDFSDRGAWQRAPAGFVRADMSPKPAYERLQMLVKDRWWT
jgi:GH35 family endo-1,4-beta-xylanase